MTKLYLDFETRSRVNLKEQGAYKYAAHESTEILCLSFKYEAMYQPAIVTMDTLNYLKTPAGIVRQMASDPSVLFVAHNAPFEIAIWRNIMVKKFGFPEVPLHRWRDTAAKASAFALPRSLEGACSALGLSAQKDMDGNRIMRKFSSPTKRGEWYWNDEEYERLCSYCSDDVTATIELDETLPDLPPEEQEFWELDQMINDRGVRVDLAAINTLSGKLEERKAQMLEEMKDLTSGEVESPTQVERTIRWLASQGVEVPDLTKATVSSALRRKNLPDAARRVLEIRQQLSKSSTAKFQSMIGRADEDGLIRGAFIYHGAATGRFAGSGIQPQNLARPVLTKEQEERDYADVVDEILEMRIDELETEYGGTFFAASSAIRGMIIPKQGNLFICSDFSAIESRCLGWVANEPVILGAYADGLDLYKVAAERIYGVPYDRVDKQQRQIGKVAALALGFQGWVGAFQQMAVGYGVVVPDDEAAMIAGKWREAHPQVVKLWAMLERAAMLAVENKGRAYSYNGISFGVKVYPSGQTFLHMRLPSGRLLSYYKPEVVRIEKNGQKKQVVSYMGVNGYTRKWERTPTYGGKLTENCWSGDTKIVTRLGLKSISSINAEDEIWDGVDWVRSQGSIFNGKQEVTTWAGENVTQNHLILDGSQWRKVMDLDEDSTRGCLKLGLALAPWSLSSGTKSGATRELQESRVIAEWWKTMGLVPSVDEGTANVKSAAPVKCRKKSTREASFTTQVLDHYGRIGGLEPYHVALMYGIKPTKTTAAGGYWYMSLGCWIKKSGSAMLSRLKGGIILSLTWIESTTRKGMSQETSGLYQEAKMRTTGEKPPTCGSKENKYVCPSSGALPAQDGPATTQYPTISEKEGPGMRLPSTTVKRAGVYDIVNCGPRNRYMVMTKLGPVIAHNCIQATSRDILRDAMRRVEAAGFPISMHVHDEIVSEIEEGVLDDPLCSFLAPDPAEYIDKFERLMSEVPPWANGFPIAAAGGWIGKRYRK